MIDIRTPTDDDVSALFRFDGRVFGAVWEERDEARQRSVMEFDRFRMAVDGTTIVGVAGSYGLQMTVPGGAAIPTGGVTWVGVSVTHRREGVLTRLIDAIHADIDARGEPLAALNASEGGIYERFGYGVCTFRRGTIIDRRRAALLPRFRPDGARLRFVDHDDPTLPDQLFERWERIRPQRPGEIARSPGWLRAMIGDRGASTSWLLHDDGYAAWKLTPNWNQGHPAHEMELLDIAAVTPDAHLALWNAVLSVDLVGPISARILALDEPLPYLLVDPRALRTVEVNDFVWCHPRDVAACFGARTYVGDDDVVVESGGARWRIGAGGCTKVRTRPDLVVEPGALGPLLMGMAPTRLAAGRRLTARSPEALRRADSVFVSHPTAHGMTGF